MAKAALVIIDDDRAADDRPAPFGLDWVAFRARQAVKAGALHVVVLAPHLSSLAMAALDRLRSEGIATAVIREGGQAADLFHPDEPVLLITGGATPAAADIVALCDAAQPTLLCIAQPGPGFEHIDASACWTGWAMIDGASVRRTATVPGDWDLGSTLLRAAVQTGAARVMVPLSGKTDGATVAEQQLAAVAPVRGGWGAHWLIVPVARHLARALAAQSTAVVVGVPVVAAIVSLGSAVLALCHWPLPAMLAAIAGLMTAATARWIATASGLRLSPRMDDAVSGSVPVAIGLAGTAGATMLVLALTTIATTALVARLSKNMGDDRWTCDFAGQAALLAVGAAFGTPGFVVALALATAHGFASLAVGQDRLSRALTQRR